MAQHMFAFWESIDGAATVQNLAAVRDQFAFTNGDDFRIPAGLTQVVWLAAGIGSGSNGIARLDAPSLLDLARYQIAPVNGRNDGNVEPDSPQAVVDLRMNPLQLIEDEAANGVFQSDTTAAAAQWIVGNLADGPVEPLTGAEVVAVRATATQTLTAGSWTLNDPITFADTLPVGNYQVVGLRAESTTCVAARLVFKGGGPRPGVLGTDAVTDWQHPIFRNGGLGVLGEFHSTTPPGIEVLANAADTAETFWLDLIKVG